MSIRELYEVEWMAAGDDNGDSPKPGKLYAQHPGGARTFVGDAYTLDAATEATDPEEGWPEGCIPVLVEPDGTELRYENGEWELFTEE